MRAGSTIWRHLASGVLPVAFAAALPLVQWCPLGTGVTLLDCLLEKSQPASAVAPTSPACANEHAGCSAREAAGGGCPLQRTSPRALCIGEPMGGPGLRPLAPDLHAPDVVLALPAMEPPALETPREPGRFLLQAEARPPTRVRATRPPVRGPPSI